MPGTIHRCAIFTYIQTSLSKSYNYRYFRTATNISTIIHISTKTPTRTRKNSPTTQLSAPNRHSPDRASSKRTNKPPPPQLVAAKGVVSIYRLSASPPAQLTTDNRSQHRRRTRILTVTTQQPQCWAWGLRSRGCGYAPQYVPQPHPQAHRSPACCRGNGTKQRRAPHPHRQQSE